MARLKRLSSPWSWVEVRQLPGGRGASGLRVGVRVRWWHPVTWLMILAALVRVLAGALARAARRCA